MTFVPASNRIPLGTVAAAAIDVCGKEHVQLDTGGERLGVEVPDEWHVQVYERARLMAGVVDDDPAAECVPPPLVTAPAPPNVGRPSCPNRARPDAAPAGPDHTHNERHGPRSNGTETG
jgi:hypothetical protein